MKEKPLRILIAEDNPVNQKVLEKMLVSFQLHAFCVNNGKEAVEEFQRNAYDVIFMDLQMPEMDGLEAAREIRKLNSNGEQPWIVAVTANTTAGIQQQCFDAGMNAFVSKPVRKENLESALHRFFTVTLPQEEGAMKSFDDVIDQQRIDELMELDDPELLKELIRIYFQESEQEAAALEQAIGNRNAEGIHHAAHKLKGGASSIGAKKVTALSLQLEKKGSSADLQGVEETFQQLRQAMMEAQEAFTKTYLSP